MSQVALPTKSTMSESTLIPFKYVNENPVDKSLECQICLEPLFDPVVEPNCRQMFCKDCLKKWLKKKGSCPNCRQKTKISATAPAPLFVTNQLDSLKVSCPLCSKEFERAYKIQHENFCEEKVVNCSASDVKCSWSGPRKDFSSHTKDCCYLGLKPILSSLQSETKVLKDKVEQLQSQLSKLEQVQDDFNKKRKRDSGFDSKYSKFRKRFTLSDKTREKRYRDSDSDSSNSYIS
eukprot:TRINITY_DN8357_c0_g1_i1.p1 TRINITY_DN8357_c0_g1~~TRINITY_DN8357_c0_g1_i1.p1  ORF type:complete len:234 (-),score=26.77 TRINITY_DN8357_c0_g1_i1:25-726(-)